MICFERVKHYCCEDITLIENYEKALKSSEKYDCHHRLEIQKNKIISVKELKKQNLYFDRPASELIFLKHTEHAAIHTKLQPHSNHTAHNKGKHYYNNGIIECFDTKCPKGFKAGRLPRSREWSKRISKSRLDNPIIITKELRTKLSISHIGHKTSEQCKEKLRINSTGRRFYNNGKINVFARECPEGFIPGRLVHRV